MDELNQNSFSRVSLNDAKMGYYPTDLECVRMIASHISPMEGINILDPCIGEGNALLEFTKKGTDVSLFGVELNKDRRECSSQKGVLTLLGDYTWDASITPGSFPLIFMNPPYGENLIEGDREERSFLERATNHISKDGIMVFIVPETIVDEALIRFMIGRYEISKVLRFPEPEYSKFKQLAVFLKRRQSNMIPLKADVEMAVENFKNSIKLLEYRKDDEPLIDIPKVSKKALKTFHTRDYDRESGMKHALWMVTHCRSHFFEDTVRVDDSTRLDVGHPLMELKPDLKYLMIASGVIHGAVAEGTEYEHYQRGTVKIVEQSEEEFDGDDEPSTSLTTETVTSRSQVTMTIIEHDGKISRLM